MKKLTMYRCSICGNIICMVEDSGVIPECCGLEMTPLEVNTKDASAEKHVPVVDRDGSGIKVTIGETLHPMTADHHIEWIAVLTNYGAYFREMNITDQPTVTFRLCREENVNAVYAYCNIHGLWCRQ